MYISIIIAMTYYGVIAYIKSEQFITWNFYKNINSFKGFSATKNPDIISLRG